MSRTSGEARGGTVESSPSVGLAVVDSMTQRRIKALASHAQGFPKTPRHRSFHRLREAQALPTPNRGPDLLFRGRHYAGFRWFPSIRNSLSGNGMVQPTLMPPPPSPRIPMNKERLIPLIVATALFMENMDSTVIATSLPAIAADIGTSPLTLKLA